MAPVHHLITQGATQEEAAMVIEVPGAVTMEEVTEVISIHRQSQEVGVVEDTSTTMWMAMLPGCPRVTTSTQIIQTSWAGVASAAAEAAVLTATMREELAAVVQVDLRHETVQKPRARHRTDAVLRPLTGKIETTAAER